MKLSSWPYFDEEERAKVSEILSSGKVNYWTGNEGRDFEKEFSKKFECQYSVALANGSLALSCAYLALNLKRGDQIITTPRSFIATASSAVLLGLQPIYADVDLNSGAIKAETIAPLLNKKIKAIVVVHLAGWPADMSNIVKLAEEYSIPIIEDCSQAHGAKINGKMVGTFGKIATWSFCQDKIISTGGEGGMLTTNNLNIYDRVWSFKDHGKSRLAMKNNHIASSFRLVHDSLGSNFRLTEIQSALGRIQLNKLDNWLEIRNKNANILISYLSKFQQIRIPLPGKDIFHSYYKFYCYVEKKDYSDGWDRNRFIKELKINGFPAYSGSCSEIYLEKCFKDIGINPKNRLKNASRLGETSLMFLVHPTILFEEMHEYSKAISKLFNLALR